jgi:hypothetical protein
VEGCDIPPGTPVSSTNTINLKNNYRFFLSTKENNLIFILSEIKKKPLIWGENIDYH